MALDLEFDPISFDNLIGGQSVLGVQYLQIKSLDEAYDFLKAYGFDLGKDSDRNKLWDYHRRAVAFIREELLTGEEMIPEILADSQQLRDIGYLLIYASQVETADRTAKDLRNWACGLLKVLHVIVHLDNDLFTRFSAEIQEQILTPFQQHVTQDADLGILLGAQGDVDRIQLKKFYIKPFKTSRSSIIKLLAKPEEVAFALLDKIGVRFVTQHLFDVFRVMRFLLKQHLVSFPHLIPDQSNNTLYPANLFMEVINEVKLRPQLTPIEIDKLLLEKLEAEKERARYKEKLNSFSSRDYRFVKFISRHLVQVPLPNGEQLSFFYPFEVQIVDYHTYELNEQGPSSHDEYKRRQIERARIRTFGPNIPLA